MNPKIRQLTFVLALFAATTTLGQTHIGLTAGGFNMHHTDEVTYFQKSSDLGWQGGVTVRQDFAKTKISLELDVIAFGFENHISGDGNYEITYIDEFGIKQRASCSNDAFTKHLGISLPILLKYNYRRVHPFIGLQIQKSRYSSMSNQFYGLELWWNDSNDNIQTYADRIKITPATTDYGFLAGFEFNVTQSLGIRFCYMKGMNDAVRYDFTAGILNGEGGTKFSESTRKETFSLNVVYTPQWRNLHFKKGSESKEKVPLKERLKEMY